MTMLPLLHLPSVDDYLGPAESRFFAAGYRRAEHTLHDVRITTRERPGVTAVASLAYPRDWSRKKTSTDLFPHVSTVDMLVIGLQLCEAYLVHVHRLGAAERRLARVRKITLKAGITPQEELTGLSAGAELRRTQMDPGAVGGRVSTFSARVGVMTARYEIEHASWGEGVADGTYTSLEDVLGSAGTRYYGDGFKLRKHTVDDVLANVAELAATATVATQTLPGFDAVVDGLEGQRLAGEMSAVDCFVTNLQLIQVLLYELDGISRQDSNTLWMQQTVLTAVGPGHPATGAATAHAAISGTELVPLRGGLWRDVTISGRLGGFEMQGSFAHELPLHAAALAAAGQTPRA
ncbi:AvrD family protein [Streptomyces sp. BK340]|uniref:AvrD family protein n=1 Tax=Streptomyces sp. BK340 TaxID=2572903 RepID=UPI0011A1A3B9|nr:AvrD family protein [Streptomyces sp. BK340]TVZ84905.1 avirulence D protein (AvrD) [Streptomyces sp. BK340]